MTRARGHRWVVRIGLWVFCALTSFYALLCYIPFTWTNFIRDHRYPAWLGFFLEFHVFIFATFVVLAIPTLTTRKSKMLFAVVSCSLAMPALLGMGPLYWTSTLWSWGISLFTWLPYLLWEVLVALDRPDQPDPYMAQPPDRLGLAACAAAGWTWIASAGLPTAHWNVSSLVALLALFLIAALVVEAWQWGGRSRRLAYAAAFVFLTWGMQRLVLDTMDFRGLLALLSAAMLSGSLLLWVPKIQWTPMAWRICLLGLLLVAPTAVPWLLAGQDWNRLLETLSLVIQWGIGGAVFFSWIKRGWTAALPSLLLLGGLAGVHWGIAQGRLAPAPTAPSTLAFQTLTRLFRSVSDEGAIYATLQAHTNLPRDERLTPKAIPFADPPAESLANKPHIFIFVIDSLRSDYCGAYNPAVRFTPHLDAFAQDSLVFKHAFTVYGATGLSEPSIWAGAHLIHKQYVLPFSPVNRLEQLVTHEGYRRYVTKDVILTELLAPETVTDALDAHTTGNYLFAKTLDELTAKLAQRGHDTRPIFVYTQPQDIHVSVLARDNTEPTKDPRWEGFNARYAARLSSIDTAFGQFIAVLKSRGLYDNSVIVVTSDHGDSLGEGGRWGHAYTLYPEILKVPLILHVPKRLQAGRLWNTDRAAYLIDITPTLYSLLGWHMKPDEPLRGQPLTVPADEAHTLHTITERVAVSSYGPVYGSLEDNGARLRLIDAVQYTATEFSMRDPSSYSAHDLQGDAFQKTSERIRRHIEQLNAAYR